MFLLLVICLAAPTDRHGDPLPDGAVARLGTVRLRSDQTFTAVAFTPDGKQLVTAASGDRLTAWDVRTGKELRRWSIGAEGANRIQFSDDGKMLAVGTSDGAALLDPRTGTLVRWLRDPGARDPGDDVATLSPDGSCLILWSRNDQQFCLLDTATGVVRGRVGGLRSYYASPVAFTPDSRHVVATEKDGKLTLYETANLRPVRDLEPGVTITERRSVSARLQGLAMLPDGKSVVALLRGASQYEVRELATGKLVRRVPRERGAPYSRRGDLRVLPGERFLLDWDQHVIRVRGLASGKVLRELSFADPISGWSLSPDGRLVAVAAGNVVQLWDLDEPRRLLADTGHSGWVNHVAFSGDGRHVLTVGASHWRLWDAATGREVMSRAEMPPHPLLPPRAAGKDGFTFGTTEQVLYRWRPGSEPKPLTRPRPTPSWDSTALSRDGRWLVARPSRREPPRVYDLLGTAPERALNVIEGHLSGRPAFSLDARYLALPTDDRGVCLVDLKAVGEPRRLPPPPGENNQNVPNHVEFSPDGRALARVDHETTLVETATGGVRLTLAREEKPHSGPPVWSADGRLVAAGLDDGTVIVHDALTGGQLLRRATGQGPVQSLAFSPDGRRLATGGTNTTALLWDVPSPRRPEVKRPSQAWDDLAATDARTAFAAMVGLIAHPADAVELLRERLRPRPALDEKRLARLVAGLDDETYRARQRAVAELTALGERARPALRKAAREGSLDARRAAEDLLARLDGAHVGVPVEVLRGLRAVEVLERIGTKSARQVLAEAARNAASPAVREVASAALSRLRATGTSSQ